MNCWRTWWWDWRSFCPFCSDFHVLDFLHQLILISARFWIWYFRMNTLGPLLSNENFLNIENCTRKHFLIQIITHKNPTLSWKSSICAAEASVHFPEILTLVPHLEIWFYFFYNVFYLFERQREKNSTSIYAFIPQMSKAAWSSRS